LNPERGRQGPGETGKPPRPASFALALALALLTVAAFLPLRHNGFILFDDPAYLTRNPQVGAGLSWGALAWAFTGTASDNWHPLTWVSHMLDVTLFGMNPAAHHLSSLLLHTLNAVLLFALLAALTGRRWPSALAAALFAVHPLHVESVAWASERKDLLAGLFWVLTLGSYLRYARRPGARRYAVTALCLGLGLLSKQMTVTLPLVLLLLDWWPLGRFAAGPQGAALPAGRTPARLVAEKIPLFALAGAAGAVTLLVQRGSGAVKGLDLIPLAPRAFNALVAYVRYLGKTLWPFELAALYPHPGPALRLDAVFGALAVLLALSAAAVDLRHRRPWLAFGWAWYLCTLLPVIGIVQVGWQSMADRYTYLPLIGIFVALCWEAAARTGSGPARRAAVAASLLLLAGLGALSRRQSATWHDSVSVFEQAVGATRDNLLAEYYLGKAQRLAGNPAEAIRHLREAIRINPRYPGVSAELGTILAERGDFEGAARAYERALQLEPPSAPLLNNLGFALAQLGRHEQALRRFEAALRLDPRHALAHANAAAALAHLGRDAEAQEHLRAAGSPP
jgi:tetratricopeptide (TPR) repeat protein